MTRGRVPRWLARSARQDRHGLAQRAHARSHASTASCAATTTARATIGASTRCTISSIPFRTPSRASRTPCARWNTKSTARCTTGWCSEAGFEHPPRQIEFARLEPHPHGDVQAPPAPLRGRRRALPAGTIRACPRSPPCAAAAIPPAAVKRFPRAAWAWPRPIATVDLRPA